MGTTEVVNPANFITHLIEITPIEHTRTDFLQSKLYCEGAMKFGFAGTTRLHKRYVRQKRYLLGVRVAPVFAALAATFGPLLHLPQRGDDSLVPPV